MFKLILFSASVYIMLIYLILILAQRPWRKPIESSMGEKATMR